MRVRTIARSSKPVVRLRGDLDLRIPRRILSAALVSLLLGSIALVVLCNEDPFARDFLCEQLGFCPSSPHPQAWNKTLYDIGMGGVVSLIFYWLLVWLPDHQKRQRLKRSLAAQYIAFKKDCISTILSTIRLAYTIDDRDELLDQDHFKEYFKEKVTDSQERWHVFLNKLDEYHLNELIDSMKIFRDELQFTLNNADIPNDESFEFLKRLSRLISSLENTTLDYDSTKRLSGVLWTIFTGWDLITGYRDHDIVEKTIRSI